MISSCQSPERGAAPTPSLPKKSETPTKVDEFGVETQTIAIFVDENTYVQLTPEIERYVKDIENDLQANVSLFHQNWQNPEDIRSRLLSLRYNNLRGTVLIGEIPAVYFDWEEEEPPPCPYAGRYPYPSDRYYMDLESELFIDNNSNGMFSDWDYLVEKPIELIWVGRIKPPVEGPEGIDLLRNYFDRNHQYRTGQSSPTKKMLVCSSFEVPELPPPMIQEGEKMVEGTPRALTLEKYLDNLYDAFTGWGFSRPLYNRSEINILVDSPRNEYLEVFQKDYEILSVNVHGSPVNQTFKDGNVEVEDIKTAQPEPYFYFLVSCFNGDFTKENYIGGHYLFDGNGLLVWALTTKGFHGVWEATHYLKFLSLGDTFGEAFVHKEEASNVVKEAVLLGDPTLRIRPKTGVPKVEANITEVDFGEVKIDLGKRIKAWEESPPLTPPPENMYEGLIEEEVIGKATVSIKNSGTEIVICSCGGYMENENGERAEELNCTTPSEILPGESKNIEISFVPAEVGTYEGFVAIASNDPDNPFIIIRLRGKGIQ